MLISESDNYRLTHSASELSGFTCTSSLTMTEKFRHEAVLLANECREISIIHEQ